MRVKKVTMDTSDEVAIATTTYLISPLSMNQVEKMVEMKVEDLTQKDAKMGAFDMVATSLNRASDALHKNTPEAERPPKWDSKRVADELDLVTFNWLQGQILDLSGLSIVKEKQPEGEAQGATVQ